MYRFFHIFQFLLLSRTMKVIICNSHSFISLLRQRRRRFLMNTRCNDCLQKFTNRHVIYLVLSKNDQCSHWLASHRRSTCQNFSMSMHTSFSFNVILIMTILFLTCNFQGLFLNLHEYETQQCVLPNMDILSFSIDQ